jgi:beta-glucosidase
MISDAQIRLANALSALNKPIVVVYLGGRPRIMTNLVTSQANAVLLAFLPGNRGAEAIADIIFGRTNPSAKLPITYPRAPNGYTTYDHLPIEDNFADPNSYEYLFPFGHGLSYTTFEYSMLNLSTSELVGSDDSVTVSVSVRNSGSVDGKEVVMLYLNDVYGSIARPVRQLKRFVKVSLRAGETKRVSFELSVDDDLSFINADSERVSESGEFNVYVGNLTASFLLKN